MANKTLNHPIAICVDSDGNLSLHTYETEEKAENAGIDLINNEEYEAVYITSVTSFTPEEEG